MHFTPRKWVPAIVGLILISPLFGLPRPVNISSIPWRVELLFSIWIAGLAAAAFRNTTLSSRIRNSFEQAPVRSITAIMAAFCVWSGLSILWSFSPASAVHHTLIWANYVIVLVFAYSVASIRGGKSIIISAAAAPALLVGALAAFDFSTIQDFVSQEGTLRMRYAKFAEMLAVIAPLLFSAALLVRNRRRFIIILLPASLAWIGVMLSLSKGAFLAGVTAFVFLFVLVAVFRRDLFRNAATAAGVWLLITIAFQFGISSFTSVPSTVNYISGSADATRSTSGMRVFTWKVAGETIRSHPVLGVGADNFGVTFNASRSAFAQADPADADSAIGEDYVFERAHNEPLQIFGELGIVGFLLFAALVLVSAAFLLSSVVRARLRISPLFFGGVAGMTAFAISSMFSSFSFRAYQNGIVFFMIFGLTLACVGKTENTERKPIASTNRWGALAVTVPVMLLAFSALKAASQYAVYFGERTPEVTHAATYFRAASLLDHDNPGADLAAAEAYVREKQWADAVPHFRRAIDRGFGVSILYSYLANAQENSGDLYSADATLKEGISIFPRSAFLRARLVFVLEKLGRHEEAAEQMSMARSIDEKQVNGWYAVIKDGILNAHFKATSDPQHVAAPPELLPAQAIYAYNTDTVRVD